MGIGVGMGRQAYRDSYGVEEHRGRCRKGCRNGVWVRKPIGGIWGGYGVNIGVDRGTDVGV